MITKLYTVRDSKTKAYFSPFHSLNEATARRSIAECMCDDSHAFSRFGEDFDLFHVGEYDDSTGCYDVHEPVHVSSLLAIRDQMFSVSSNETVDQLRVAFEKQRVLEKDASERMSGGEL